MAENLHNGHRDRIKQKYIHYGCEQFHEHELMELLLFYSIPRKDTNEIAHRLINRFGSIHALLSATYEQIAEVEGIGEHTAVLLKLCGDLVKRCGLEDHPIGTQLTSTKEIGEYLLPRFWGIHDEALMIVTLNNRFEAIKDTIISRGTLTANSINIQMVLQQALRDGATMVIMAHNHPSGHALPSRNDIEITANVACELRKIHVELVDHIIISDSDFVSLRESRQTQFVFS